MMYASFESHFAVSQESMKVRSLLLRPRPLYAGLYSIQLIFDEKSRSVSSGWYSRRERLVLSNS